MSRLKLILRGLWFHRPSHAGVFAGVIIATAVLTGALIMGDSVHHTLRSIALARLGTVQHGLTTPYRFVTTGLVDALRQDLDAEVSGMLRADGMAIHQDEATGHTSQVNRVQVLGTDSAFWEYVVRASARQQNEVARPGTGEVFINEKLADALGAQSGDVIALRIAKPSLMALDAPLSPRGEDRFVRTRVNVTGILPDDGPGRFSLTSGQIAPYNAFVPLEWLAEQSGLAGRANTILVGEGPDEARLSAALDRHWAFADAGLRLEAHADGVAQRESDRIFLEDPVIEAALEIPGAKGTLAYLVNAIGKGDVSTPYSFAVAGAVPEDFGDEDAAINEWTADQIGAAVGDRIRVAYYEVTPANEFIERSRDFTVRAVWPMDSLAGERDLIPDFPGLSDVESCSDWDIGMPLEETALNDPANEAYWKAYRQTPKLYVTLAAGQAMWGNRFGKYTAVRFPDGARQLEALRESIRAGASAADLGLAFAPVRAQALEAVDKSMDFGGLFLGMSFFLILAALLLTGLLFVFGVQQRSEELGTLLVVGFRPGQVRALVLAEAGLVALVGSAVGAVAGTVYARLLTLGLSRFWDEAVAHTAVAYHAKPATLLIGGIAGFGCAMVAVTLAAWRLTRRPASVLLAADFSQMATRRTRSHVHLILPALGIVLGAAGTLGVLIVSPANASMSFFGIGALLLASGIGLWRGLLIRVATRPSSQHLTLSRLAMDQVARRPGRSVAAAGLLASGVFLVLSVSAMREDLAGHVGERWSGTGGFALFAESTVPMDEPLDKGLDADGVRALPIRVRDGDDASCLNLNYSPQPRMLGVDVETMNGLGAFDRATGEENVWRLLERDLGPGVVPALVGDTDTAMWGLRLKADPADGDTLEYRDEAGRPFSVKLVGALPMRLSVFQGSLLISNSDFTRIYPSESGFRMFLIDAPSSGVEKVAAALKKSFERYGLDVTPSLDRLREFYTVESTYLAMFLVLGGLGVTLGGAGMGIVMLRNLLERRGELAMLDVVGYAPRTVLRMLLIEHAALLLAGTGIGAVAAGVSTAPSVVASGTEAPAGLQAFMLALVVLTGAVCMALALWLGRPGDSLEALRDE